MRTETTVIGDGTRRVLALLLISIAAIVALAAWAATAGAETPAHTDVMLLFDTSGSMGGQLEEAKSEIEQVETKVRSSLPDVEFGVAEVRDFPPSEEEETFEKPWKLDQPLTSDAGLVKAAIEPLTAGGGGDSPESYGRALWETDTNPNVGWRPEAKHIIILIADNVPHDHELDEGIPEGAQVQPPPFDTGEELAGLWKIPGSIWTPATNRDFQTTLRELSSDGKPLGMVDFRGDESGYLPYWEYWAGLTGGQALLGGTGELATKVATLIETRASAALPACPTGQIRRGTGSCFTPHATATQVICNLIIATASDECTATVGDAAPAGSTNPSGTVTFTSSSGGVFPAGNTCVLKPTIPGNTSSCTAQFLPPTAPSTLPAITANYGGDETHLSSVGQTHYGAASSLSSVTSLSEAGTVTPGGTVEIPVSCGYPCEVGGGLYTGPDLGKLSAFSSGGEAALIAYSATKGHKKAKPILLGRGKLKLSKPGKGKLVIRLTAKAKRNLHHISRKGVRLTVKFTVDTLNGTLVENKTAHIRVKPKKTKKKAAQHH